mmetsp:Transcript_11548/g.22178  ORF Transcript_11548/g.22178 Transcript_11548/m.22178 type:complete len:206 (-) Transcript_11548:539-1156(-)
MIIMLFCNDSWEIIKESYCVFRYKKNNDKFCYSKINTSFLCKKFLCPLINENYAALVEDNGNIYLWIKSLSKNNANNYLWNKYKLSANFLVAKEQIEIILYKWPSYFFYFLKIRLRILFHYLIKIQTVKNKNFNKYTLIKKEVRNISKISQYIKNKFNIYKMIIKELKLRLHKGLYNKIYYKYKNKYKINKKNIQKKKFLQTLTI